MKMSRGLHMSLKCPAGRGGHLTPAAFPSHPLTRAHARTHTYSQVPYPSTHAISADKCTLRTHVYRPQRASEPGQLCLDVTGARLFAARVGAASVPVAVGAGFIVFVRITFSQLLALLMHHNYHYQCHYDIHHASLLLLLSLLLSSFFYG